jgi:hypothetical protein
MGRSESDPTPPKDELRAALADIETSRGEQAARVPDPDGNPEDANGSSAAHAAPEPQRPAPNTQDTAALDGADALGDEAQIDAALDQLQAFAAEFEASSGGGDPSGPTAPAEQAEAGDPATSSGGSLGDEQLRAASAEVETISPGQRDGAARHAAVADGHANEACAPGSANKLIAAKLVRNAGREEEDRDAAVRTEPTRPGDTLGKSRSGESRADPESPGKAHGAEAARGALLPITSVLKCVRRGIDRALDRINQPFAALDDQKRALVGWAAITTLIVSLLAMLLIPKILPQRDAITFLQEKRARLDAPPPAKVPRSPEMDD